MQTILEGGREDTITQRGRLRLYRPGDDGDARLEVPGGPDGWAGHYDVTTGHPAVEAPAFGAFDRWLAQEAAARGLRCALFHDGNVAEATRRLELGQLTVGLHLDYFALWHVAGDPYARLSQAVEDAGGRPINPPHYARIFTDKAVAHTEFMRAGLGVPDAVLVRPWSAERPLASAEYTRLRLGDPGAGVFVKPANGFGGRGVTRTDAAGLAAAVAAARAQHRGDCLLLQREVGCPQLKGDDGTTRPAYWRVLCCLGELIPFWWSSREAEHGRPHYRRVTAAEVNRHHLRPVLAYVQEVAALTRLAWFSTELCLSTGAEPSRFRVPVGARDCPVVAIDYVNDQCDVDVQSRWAGAPPDAVVRYLAARFADAAWQRHPSGRVVRLAG